MSWIVLPAHEEERPGGIAAMTVASGRKARPVFARSATVASRVFGLSSRARSASGPPSASHPMPDRASSRSTGNPR
ncbi:MULTISPECIES: hypothetical protein [Streptomyces]|uniref:hypothetical protein n=1 Tax=Streptomyces TaxID=1883 RepID=UPI0021AED5B4|nr:hypothetical protein [Streptomyces sp. WAC05858]